MKHVLCFCALAMIAGCGPTEGYEYVPCSSTTTSVCMGGSSCRSIVWMHGSGSLCTSECGVDGDCPHHGNCIDVNGSGTFLCYERCTTTDDCPMPFVCGTLSTGEGVCLPRTP